MDKKELRELYKARKIVGGIYRICNKENGCFWLQSTDDIQSAHNLLSFSRATKNMTIPALRDAWAEFGPDAFEIEELERLEKKPEQDVAAFRSDLEVLLEYWDEKLPQENRYK